MTDPRPDTLDEQWCARQDALALGEELGKELGNDEPHQAPSDPALAPAWADELAFYEALSAEARGNPNPSPSPEDLTLIEQVLAQDAMPSAEEHTALGPSPRADVTLVEDGPTREASGLGRGLRGGVALLAIAAAVVLGLVLLTPDLGLRSSAGAWVAQEDRRRVEPGDALPQAVWLVAERQACAQREGASVCAAQGSVVRIHPERGDTMTLELRRGSVTVKGAVDVLTAQGTLKSRDDSHYEVRLDGEVVDVEVLGGSLQLVESGSVRTLAVGAPLRLGEAPARPRRVESVPPTPEPQPASDPDLDPDPEPAPAPEPNAKDRTPTRPPRSTTKAASPAAPDQLLARARTLSGQGDKRSAARAYVALIDAHPRSSEAQAARVSLGRLRLQAGRPKAALALFRRYLQGKGSLAEEALWGQIKALDALGRESELARAVEQLARRYPRSVYRTRAEELIR